MNIVGKHQRYFFCDYCADGFYIFNKITDMNEHLTIEVKEKFLVVTCPEGHYITNWDKEDILAYSSAKTMYCPLSADLTGYYCVTEEEHNELVEKQREAAENIKLSITE